ncbi:MAG: GerMN domain-containing protein [Clostridiales bacterium]|jgi:germination protein M|nr:GerMN domain-containing protein [Clostridiales bacterium]
MRKLANKYKLYSVLAFVLFLFALAGCGQQQSTNGSPIEPIIPGKEKGESQALQGRFSVKSADIQIHDLSVTADGTLAAVGSASRAVYLLERDGKPRWEKPLSSQPVKTYLDPIGRFMAVGTSQGKLLILNIDGEIRTEQNFDAPISTLSAAGDGELFLIGVSPENPQEPDQVVVMDRAGRIRWEASFEEVLDAKISGSDNRVFVNWRQNNIDFLTAYGVNGNVLWEIENHTLLSLDGGGRMLASSRGEDVLMYNKEGRQLWKYTTTGLVKRVILAKDGLYAGALVTDVATQQQELLYFNIEGELLWSKRLPDDSEVLVSSDGMRVLVASWRQYRDDATQIFVYNSRGMEVNALEVAGRAQRMALAEREGTLVLGLEDGSIYFLNISEQTVSSREVMVAATDPQRLSDFYTPVSFGREEGESRLTLFFFDETAQFLVPVTRRIKRTQSLLRPSIEELIRGPVQGSQLQRTIPKDAEISATIQDGTVQVDLPLSLDEMGGTTFLLGVLDSLLLTVSQFPTVEQIRFTVGGEEKETFGQEGILIDEAHNPRRFGRQQDEQLLFIPASSGTRLYLLPATKEFLPLKEKALVETLVTHILSESAAYLPKNVKLKSVRLEDSIVYLDFNEEFAQLLVENPEAAARAAILRDAFALSIAENLPYATVHITVEGKPLRRPAEFLPWQLTLSRPYFINLED